MITIYASSSWFFITAYRHTLHRMVPISNIVGRFKARPNINVGLGLHVCVKMDLARTLLIEGAHIVVCHLGHCRDPCHVGEDWFYLETKMVVRCR